jgi:Flp pilus assembly protein TadB
MNHSRPTPVWFWVLYAIPCLPLVAPLIVMMIAMPEVSAIVGVLDGAFFIRWIVRRTNRHHDSRLAKRPAGLR